VDCNPLLKERAVDRDVARANATITNKTEPTMSIKFSENYIDDIALQLDEDTSGANGELDTKQIRDRLMQSIVERSGHSGIEMSIAEHEHKPALTLSQASSLIMRVWLHKDRQVMEEVMSSLPPVAASRRCLPSRR
jgi:hypothetical protein